MTPRPQTQRLAVLAVMGSDSLTPREVAHRSGIRLESVRSYISLMVRQGLVRCDRPASMANQHKVEGRYSKV